MQKYKINVLVLLVFLLSASNPIVLACHGTVHCKPQCKDKNYNIEGKNINVHIKINIDGSIAIYVNNMSLASLKDEVLLNQRKLIELSSTILELKKMLTQLSAENKVQKEEYTKKLDVLNKTFTTQNKVLVYLISTYYNNTYFMFAEQQKKINCLNNSLSALLTQVIYLNNQLNYLNKTLNSILNETTMIYNATNNKIPKKLDEISNKQDASLRLFNVPLSLTIATVASSISAIIYLILSIKKRKYK